MFDMDGSSFDSTQYKELLEVDFYLVDKLFNLVSDYYDPVLTNFITKFMKS